MSQGFIPPHGGYRKLLYLLDRQIRRLEQEFVEEGGLRERMTRARLNERARQTTRKHR
ncbi:MAG: hypothetical protein CVU57_17105 [Deltaproteobacteria bacterium HGW-Deltaproteobacteria-15]|nr:MAG: hypothetical protein CVU57_17105 [Deltaproteobacteria bacterium HGW-Deltaproteobacteria-15]